MNRKHLELAVALRHRLHAHPELSGQERWTKAHLMEFLRQNTPLEVVDRGAWFYAVHRGAPQGKKLAFRADFDALPIDETISLPYGSTIAGVSHKCGHDGHSAALAAFAMELGEKGCRNTVYLIFQHAEETGAGARECAALLKEEGIHEIYGWHNEPGYPEGEVIVRKGCFQCASRGMSLYFTGSPAHAATPEEGRNPALAIARVITAIPALQRPEDHQGLVLCTVIQVEIGQEAFGTSAHQGVLRVTLRGENQWELDALEEHLDTLARREAKREGLDYHAEFCDDFPENRNHDHCVDKVVEAAQALNIPVHRFPRPKRGSEDFGHYTRVTAGAFFNIGAGDITPHHTATYDFPDGLLPVGAAMFCKLAEVE
ncbi:MAG: amidohydrolase [Clostridia bacterium]|nr:amidohydrolase [Clostridia bacterium]